MTRQNWIETDEEVAVVRQCVLAGVSRATVYAHKMPMQVDETDLLLSGLIDEEYTRHPFYGSRRMVIFLGVAGHSVNRKRVQRLMRQMGLAGMAPGPNTSGAHPEHKVYPYLLRGVPVIRPQPGLEHRHHLHTAGAWIRVPGGDHRLVLALRAQLAHQQQYGVRVLCRLPGGGIAHPRQAGDLQQRSGITVHQRRLYRRTQA